MCCHIIKPIYLYFSKQWFVKVFKDVVILCCPANWNEWEHAPMCRCGRTNDVFRYFWKSWSFLSFWNFSCFSWLLMILLADSFITAIFLVELKVLLVIKSSPQNADNGVPRGSFLGPLLVALLQLCTWTRSKSNHFFSVYRFLFMTSTDHFN